MNLLATGGRTVPPEWIDYIGHMMDAYYFVAFTEATEAFLDHLGLGEHYRADSGCGMYTVESHLCFSRSVRAGTVLRYDSQLLGCDQKRLHVFHRMSQSPGEAIWNASWKRSGGWVMRCARRSMRSFPPAPPRRC